MARVVHFLRPGVHQGVTYRNSSLDSKALLGGLPPGRGENSTLELLQQLTMKSSWGLSRMVTSGSVHNSWLQPSLACATGHPRPTQRLETP